MVCAIFAMTANAATTPEIANMNVQYTDKFCLVYAVPADTVSGGSATLYLHEDYPTETGVDYIKKYEVSKTTLPADSGLDYDAYIFYTDGVEAMALDKVFYSQVVDAAGNASEVKSYSVVEYLYTRLADVDGKPNTDVQNDLYKHVIGFGTNAQKLFLEADVLATRTLISDYFYLTTEGCTVDGKTAGVFPQNKTFEVKYDNLACSDYSLTTYTGYDTSEVKDAQDISGTSLNVTVGNRVHVASGNIPRTYRDNVVTFENETVGATPSNVNSSANGGFIYSDAWVVHRNCIKVKEDTVFGEKSKVVSYQPTEFGRFIIYPTLGCDAADSKALELSFDMRVDTSTLNEEMLSLIEERSEWPYYTFNIYFYYNNNSNNMVSYVRFSVLGDGKLQIDIDGNDSMVVPATVYANNYNSFRFVLRYDDVKDKNYIDVYVNNFTDTPNASFESAGAGEVISGFTRTAISPGYSSTSREFGAAHYFDNIWFGFVNE